MYLGELLAYPIWLYVGISVIATVRHAWQKMEEQQASHFFFRSWQKNNQKTQKDDKKVLTAKIKRCMI